MAQEVGTENEFAIMEAEDENQIISADDAIKQALVYKVNGKTELSYIGLKHIILIMSQKEQPLSIVEHEVRLIGDTPQDKVWYATIKVKNLKTGYESVGLSEQPYQTKDKTGQMVYDVFGRTKAFSKAERNAWRKQIPELEIRKLVDDASKLGQVKEINKGYCICPGGTTMKDMSKTPPVCMTCKKPSK